MIQSRSTKFLSYLFIGSNDHAACHILLAHGLVSFSRFLMGHHPISFPTCICVRILQLNALEEGLVATDSTGSVVYANQAAENLFMSCLKTGGSAFCLPDDGTSGQERTGTSLMKDTLSGFLPNLGRPVRCPAQVRHRACTCEKIRRLLVSEIRHPDGASGDPHDHQ